MYAVTLKVNTPCRAEMEHHGKFIHTLGWIYNIANMSIIYICYTAYCLVTQTVAHNLPGFESLNICIIYLSSHPHKPIFILIILMMDQI